MAIALVKSAKGTATASPVTCSFASPTTSGNLVVLFWAANLENASPPDAGWTQSAEMGPGIPAVSYHKPYMWWRFSTGETNFAFTFTGPTYNASWMLMEFSGVAASPYDTSQGWQDNTSASTAVSDPVTPSTGNRIIIVGCGGSSSTENLTSGIASWTNSFAAIDSVGQALAVTYPTLVGTAYRLVTGDGSTTYATTATYGGGTSPARSMLALVFKDAAATGSTLDLDFTTPTLDPRITFTRSTTGTYYDSAGVLQTAAINAARFDYDPVTHTAKGLLIEEARTNSLVRSQELDNASWIKTNATITADAAAAPDGTTTADRLVASLATFAYTHQVSNLTTGTTYTQSIYAKRDTSDWMYLGAYDGVTLASAWFNLATGTLGTVQAGTAGLVSAAIQSVGGGWYRCIIVRTGTAAATNELIQFGVCDADNVITVTVGRTIYLWGAQLEAGAFATSYIPTVTTVTRAADVAVMTGTNFSSWYNQAQGTFVAEYDMLGQGPASIQMILQADDGTNNENVRFLRFNAAWQADITHLGGGAATFAFAPAITYNAAHKIGISYALNDFAGCLDGGTVGTDTSGAPATPTQLRLGTNAAAQILNGHLRRIQFYTTAKTDAELITLTTLTSTAAVTGAQTLSAVTQAGTIATTVSSVLPGGGYGTAYFADAGEELAQKRRRQSLREREERLQRFSES